MLKLGDIHLREEKTVLLKLILPGTKNSQHTTLNIHLNYFDMRQISEKEIPKVDLTVTRKGKDLICELNACIYNIYDSSHM